MSANKQRNEGTTTINWLQHLFEYKKNINQRDLCEKGLILGAKGVIEIRWKALRARILN